MRKPTLAVILLGVMLALAGSRARASEILWTFETGG